MVIPRGVLILALTVTMGAACPAEEPVDFGHWAIKAAVEDQLWITDPTPTDRLGLLSLSCVARQVDNIEGLQYAKNLRKLTLSDNNHISDISVLSGLKELEVLIVNQNNIRDLCLLGTGEPVVTYSNIGGYGSGLGNMDTDPYFVQWGSWIESSGNPSSGSPTEPSAIWNPGDYHLQSESGLWEPGNRMWLIDAISSPCIDAGDPNASVGLEIHPNGQRINLGAYGGTVEASRTPSDTLSDSSVWAFLFQWCQACRYLTFLNLNGCDPYGGATVIDVSNLEHGIKGFVVEQG